MSVRDDIMAGGEAVISVKRRDWREEVYDWVETLSFSLIVVVLLFSFLFKLVQVDGKSMQNTLMDHDRVMIQSLFYEPRQFDVVVINDQNYYHKPLIKRIIAVEGQIINIDFEKGVVTVDGIVLDEPYIKEITHIRGNPKKPDYLILYPATVPEGKVFVMGDNRNESSDSRELGFIDKKSIMGRALVRVYPFDQIKIVK